MTEELSSERDHSRYARQVKNGARKRRSELIEARLVSDFCREYMKGYRCILRCRVGPLYSGQLERGRSLDEAVLLGNWRYFADAVCIGEKDLILVEAAVRFGSDHVGKLLGYSYLLAITPELMEFHDRQLRLLGVSAQFDPLAALMLKRFDIEAVEYKPEYVRVYIEKLELRKRRPSLALLSSHARYGESSARGYRV